jgi:hypothetical protein
MTVDGCRQHVEIGPGENRAAFHAALKVSRHFPARYSALNRHTEIFSARAQDWPAGKCSFAMAGAKLVVEILLEEMALPCAANPSRMLAKIANATILKCVLQSALTSE